jgi:hypothetical protein
VTPPPPAAPAQQCADGIDNDHDGKIDVANDPGCVNDFDNDETDPQVIVVPGATQPVFVSAPPPPPPPAVTTGSTAPTLLSPFPVVRLRGRIVRTGVVVNLLTVHAPAGSRIMITCRGPKRSCPTAKLTRATTGRQMRFRSFQRSMRAGTILKIYVTKRGYVGKYTRFTIRRNAAPSRGDSCARISGAATACPR